MLPVNDPPFLNMTGFYPRDGYRFSQVDVWFYDSDNTSDELEVGLKDFPYPEQWGTDAQDDWWSIIYIWTDELPVGVYEIIVHVSDGVSETSIPA